MKLRKSRLGAFSRRLTGILALLAFLAAPLWVAAEDAPAALEPGLYQTAGAEAAVRLQQIDKAWEILFWQGGAATRPGAGFAFLGRMLPRPESGRLAGTWQSLPGSCCPGRGRGEIEALGPKSFRFSVFSPSLDQSPWSPLLGEVFEKVAELPVQPPLAKLTGSWRISLWYNDLLPGGAPSDLVEGKLSLAAGQGLAKGSWQGRPGELLLTPRDNGLELHYKDAAAGYELNASLSEEAGGLALEGPFRSTLGQGRLRLVRAGLPADPAGPQANQGGDLGGIWVDPRTGNDYFQIKDTPQGFDFTAFGGSLAQPRYLSKGSARRAGPGRFEASARDLPGHCCGNQARLVFRALSPDRMEVSSIWWPAGQADPGSPPAEPYQIERAQKEAGAKTLDHAAAAGRWPLVREAKPGLLARNGGAVKVEFSWQPNQQTPANGKGQSATAHTLFSQGGYLRDLDLYLDAHGRLSARIQTKAGPLTLAAAQAVKPHETHTAWLSYAAGGEARLFLDDSPLASANMAQPWAGSNSPYLMGASRWPGRSFQGEIKRVELFAGPQNPAQPGEPALVITPQPAAAAEPSAAADQDAPAKVLTLERWWSPGRLVHAYAARPQDQERLRAAGFARQGPVAGLWEGQVPGSGPLYGFRHRGQGYTLLSPGRTPPPGCDALGLMGYVLDQPSEGSVALHELAASLDDPLRGHGAKDILYTTLPQTVAAARQAGYGQERLVGYARPVEEMPFAAPVLYTWQGSWQGEGWGRFFIKRQGQDILMFWYYGRADGPHYLGRYQLSPDLKKAEGIAVGRPGKGASYYRHLLEFITDSPQGPRIKLTSWRLAAPLDDGRLVHFARPKPTTTLLLKEAQAVPAAEGAEAAKALGPPDPAAMLEQALQAAREKGQLLER